MAWMMFQSVPEWTALANVELMYVDVTYIHLYRRRISMMEVVYSKTLNQRIKPGLIFFVFLFFFHVKFVMIEYQKIGYLLNAIY